MKKPIHVIFNSIENELNIVVDNKQLNLNNFLKDQNGNSVKILTKEETIKIVKYLLENYENS